MVVTWLLRGGYAHRDLYSSGSARLRRGSTTTSASADVAAKTKTKTMRRSTIEKPA